MSASALAESEQTYTYVITETTGPTSLDPLDADSTNNLPVARMIYATPLEISDQNQLTSSILDSFEYDRAKAAIYWSVKSGLSFQDGTPITADDVAFAVARMAFARPKFPVIQHIRGVEDWAAEPGALSKLPSGISVDGKKISIRLKSNLEHPLFRFCLELFSVIPKRCVDVQTNKISCKEIPESGYYRLLSKTAESLMFERRKELRAKETLPRVVRFEYVPVSEVGGKSFGERSVISGNELMYSRPVLKDLESRMVFRPTPASRFAGFLLHPQVKPFQDKNCRRYFSRLFRESYAEVADKSQSLETSLFTKVLPGYLTASQLLNMSPKIPEPAAAKCRQALREATITWGYVRGEKSIFHDVMKATLKKLGGKESSPFEAKDRKELISRFVDRELGVSPSSSGFWALDPAGDLKMLFTPSLHKMLQFVAADAQLQEMIEKAEKDPGQFGRINQYLYDEALINVYAHLRRFYAFPDKSGVADIPFAITSPAPWQVFRQ